MTILNRKISYLDLFTITVFAALFIYVLVRAYLLSFTCDESMSYSIIAGDPRWVYTVNNHFLNTFFMKLFSLFFGESEIALRLPNVFTFILYLSGLFLFLNKSQNAWYVLLGSSLILFNPFLIDFFSLARGYGLSLGLIMMSLYYLLRGNFISTDANLFVKDYIFSLAFAAASVLASLGTINYLIALIVLYFIKFVLLEKDIRQTLLKNRLFITATSSLFIYLLMQVILLLLLSSHNKLYFGADTLTEFINSMIIDTLYLKVYDSWYLFKYAVISSIPLGLLSLFIQKDYFSRFSISAALLILLIIGIVLEHYLFSVKYPIGRTGLYFIPIYGLFIYHFVLHSLEFYPSIKRVSVPIIIIISFPFLFNFISNINFVRVQTWRNDTHTKDMMKIVEKYTSTSNKKLSISNNWRFYPTINYYIKTRGINLESKGRQGPDSKTDFIYDFNDFPIQNNFKSVINFHDIGTHLQMKNNLDKY